MRPVADGPVPPVAVRVEEVAADPALVIDLHRVARGPDHRLGDERDAPVLGDDDADGHRQRALGRARPAGRLDAHGVHRGGGVAGRAHAQPDHPLVPLAQTGQVDGRRLDGDPPRRREEQPALRLPLAGAAQVQLHFPVAAGAQVGLLGQEGVMDGGRALARVVRGVGPAGARRGPAEDEEVAVAPGRPLLAVQRDRRLFDPGRPQPERRHPAAGRDAAAGGADVAVLREGERLVGGAQRLLPVRPEPDQHAVGEGVALHGQADRLVRLLDPADAAELRPRVVRLVDGGEGAGRGPPPRQHQRHGALRVAVEAVVRRAVGHRPGAGVDLGARAAEHGQADAHRLLEPLLAERLQPPAARRRCAAPSRPARWRPWSDRARRPPTSTTAAARRSAGRRRGCRGRAGPARAPASRSRAAGPGRRRRGRGRRGSPASGAGPASG
jgi:hypothetical protein